jgi:leucyl-tRNA synthetase
MAGAGRSEAPDRRADRAIRRASACYRRGAVHTAIAEARGLVKDLTDPGGGAPGSGRGSRAGWETALHLLNPVIPHVSEALWARMGHRTPLLARAWPVADRGGLVENRRTMPIHIDGRRRAVVSLPRGATRQVVARAALAVPAVRARLRDHVPRSVIVVPDRLVNIVL